MHKQDKELDNNNNNNSSGGSGDGEAAIEDDGQFRGSVFLLKDTPTRGHAGRSQGQHTPEAEPACQSIISRLDSPAQWFIVNVVHDKNSQERHDLGVIGEYVESVR